MRFARLTRWMDRQWLAADYNENRTLIGFICFLPLMLGIFVLDQIPSLFFVGLGVSAALGTWAGWRWFKGYGSTRYSTRKAQEYHKAMAAKHDG